MTDYIKREAEDELRAFVKKILLQKREEMTSMINKREDDYIKRKDAIEKFAGVTLIACDKTTAESPYSLSAAEKFFADIPSADVIEVDRCKDCKYYENGVCANINFLSVKPDDYCSYAEKVYEVHDEDR